MRRRTLLAATASVAGIAGCPSPSGDGSEGPETPLPGRRTADAGTTTFDILDVRARTPTSSPVTVRFEAGRVVVTGAMTIDGCREPVLQSVGYGGSSSTLRIVVGTESTFGPSPTAVCERGVYRYRCVVSTRDRIPTTVEVVYDYEERDDRTFVHERE